MCCTVRLCQVITNGRRNTHVEGGRNESVSYGWGLKEYNTRVAKNNCKADALHLPIDCFDVPKGLLWSRGMQDEKGST